MGLMQPQVIGPVDWWEVETTQGTFWVQCEDAGYKDVIAKDLITYLPVPDTDCIVKWEFRSGYGARMSAPGFLDCTDWTVFDTEEEAQRHLEETYGEEEGRFEVVWYDGGASGKLPGSWDTHQEAVDAAENWKNEKVASSDNPALTNEAISFEVIDHG